MRTVKEVSELTGISVRTLHYYDEIGLFVPTVVSEAGYRLYDDKALERLQQILFFREFDMPLKEIKNIMENPDLDKNQLLQSQKQVLVLKKERLERIIASIDDILKGENKMNFEIFSKADIEQLYNAMVENMPEKKKADFIEKYGSMEQYKEHFMDSASGEKAQKNFAKLVEWYGDKCPGCGNKSGKLSDHGGLFEKIGSSDAEAGRQDGCGCSKLPGEGNCGRTGFCV